MQQTYELKKMDDKLWVSVHELMNDIKDALEKLTNLSDPRLIEVDKKEIDAKILGLHAIYTFLGALVTEQTLLDKKKELEGTVTISNIRIHSDEDTLH